MECCDDLLVIVWSSVQFLCSKSSAGNCDFQLSQDGTDINFVSFTRKEISHQNCTENHKFRCAAPQMFRLLQSTPENPFDVQMGPLKSCKRVKRILTVTERAIVDVKWASDVRRCLSYAHMQSSSRESSNVTGSCHQATVPIGSRSSCTSDSSRDPNKIAEPSNADHY